MLSLLIHFFIKYWKYIAVLGLIFIAASGYWLYTALLSPAPKAKPIHFAYADIIPGQSSHQQLIDQVGVFAAEYNQGEYTVYTYNSEKSRYAPDRFYLLNDVVSMKELSFNPLQYKLNRAVIEDYYGKPDATFYDQSSAMSGITTEVSFYARTGMAVYTRTDNYWVTRVQFFSPVSVETYQDTWGKGLTTKKPTPAKESPHTE